MMIVTVSSSAVLAIRTERGSPRSPLFEDFVTSYEEFQAEREEIVDIGNGVTFTVTIFKGRLVGSSGQLQLRFPSVTVWTDGLIERQTDYMDIAEARAAAERLAEERG
jgi:hypothetical protein